MRLLTTLAYGFAAALLFVAVAAAVIGTPDSDGVRGGGLTAATILRSDGSRADARVADAPPLQDDSTRPSS